MNMNSWSYQVGRTFPPLQTRKLRREVQGLAWGRIVAELGFRLAPSRSKRHSGESGCSGVLGQRSPGAWHWHHGGRQTWLTTRQTFS